MSTLEQLAQAADYALGNLRVLETMSLPKHTKVQIRCSIMELEAALMREAVRR